MGAPRQWTIWTFSVSCLTKSLISRDHSPSKTYRSDLLLWAVSCLHANKVYIEDAGEWGLCSVKQNRQQLLCLHLLFCRQIGLGCKIQKSKVYEALMIIWYSKSRVWIIYAKVTWHSVSWICIFMIPHWYAWWCFSRSHKQCAIHFMFPTCTCWMTLFTFVSSAALQQLNGEKYNWCSTNGGDIFKLVWFWFKG